MARDPYPYPGGAVADLFPRQPIEADGEIADPHGATIIDFAAALARKNARRGIDDDLPWPAA